MQRKSEKAKKKVQKNLTTQKVITGDWKCGKCNNMNFSFRTVCNRCEAKYEDIKGFNSAVFMTSSPIDTDNVSTQNSTPIQYELEELPEIESLLAEVAEKLKIQDLNYPKFKTVSPEISQEESQETKSHSFRKKTKKPPQSRTGDWMCGQCGNINFAFRKECNICMMPQVRVDKEYQKVWETCP